MTESRLRMAYKEAATRRVRIRAFYAIMQKSRSHARIIVSEHIKAFQKFICVNLRSILECQCNENKSAKKTIRDMIGKEKRGRW